MNHKIQGWNECLIAYVLAASHPRFAIDAKVYHKGWTAGNHFKNGKTYLNVTLPLGFDYGGPSSSRITAFWDSTHADSKTDTPTISIKMWRTPSSITNIAKKIP